MRIGYALSLLLAIPAGFLAMGQVSDLQTVSRGFDIGTGAAGVMATSTFLMLFLVVIAALGAFAGALSIIIKGR